MIGRSCVSKKAEAIRLDPWTARAHIDTLKVVQQVTACKSAHVELGLLFSDAEGFATAIHDDDHDPRTYQTIL
jgi:hypothetical protein